MIYTISLSKSDIFSLLFLLAVINADKKIQALHTSIIIVTHESGKRCLGLRVVVECGCSVSVW